MTRIALGIAAALALAAVFPAAPARATGTLTRTFVSSSGVDTNPCTITQPCATFAHAYSLTAPDGIIAALDPGKYGPLTITGPITINGNGWAAITGTAQGAAITINGGSGNIILTGLELDGAGAAYDGILFNSGSNLTVTNCTIQNFIENGNDVTSGDGIFIGPNTGALSFVVTNTTLSYNGYAGFFYYPGVNSGNATGNVNGVIDHVVATNNITGIQINTEEAFGLTTVAISNSIVSNNSLQGINIADNESGTDSAPYLIVSVDNTAISGNGTGLVVADTSKVLLGRSAITGNGTGINASNESFFFTYKDNRINGNGTNISGTPPTTDGLQ
jgi:hypothetical protein